MLEDPPPESVPPPKWFSWTRPPGDGRTLPRGARSGSFQKLLFRVTGQPLESYDSMSMHDLTAQATFAVPPFLHGTPLLLTPFYNGHLLSGPEIVDAPPRLMDTGLEVRWMNQLTPDWGVDVAVSPSWWSDGQNNSRDAVRVTGRVLAAYTWSERTQVIAGVVYLDRADVSILPAFGLLITPDEATRWELVMPRPRYAKRLLGATETRETWAYIGGEFGGGSYAVERASGADDVLTYSDYRLVIGLDRKNFAGISTRTEFGYVFGRALEYTSTQQSTHLDDNLLWRLEVSY